MVPPCNGEAHLGKPVDPAKSMELAAEIVVAFLNKRAVEPEQLGCLIRDVRRALETEDDEAAAPVALPTRKTEEARPSATLEREEAFSPPERAPNQATVFDDHLICLEDGKPYKSLR